MVGCVSAGGVAFEACLNPTAMTLIVFCFILAFIFFSVLQDIMAWLFFRCETPLSRDTSRGACLGLARGRTHVSFLPATPENTLNNSKNELVVFVHGLGGSLDQLSFEGGMSEALNAAGFDVLTFDLLGHGSSESPAIDYDAALFAQQLTEILFHLNVTKPFHLYGFSMGTFIR